MPSNDPIQRFEEILDNIGRIEQYTAGMNVESFTVNHETRDAVERCLERICEPSKKLGSMAEDLCPNIPWPRIRALGNFLRHEYDRVEVDRIWFLIERDLPALKVAVQSAVERLPDNPL